MHPYDTSSIQLRQNQKSRSATWGKPKRRRPLLSFKDIFWFLYLYPLRMLASVLSGSSLYWVGRAVEPFVQLATIKRKGKASMRMAKANDPRLSSESIPATVNRFVSNAIWRVLDDLTLSDPKASLRMAPPEIDGLHHLTDALAEGKGVVLTSGHFFANRLGKIQLQKLGHPILSVRNGKPPDPWMGRLGARLLQRRYVEFLRTVIKDEVFIQDPDCSLKILKRLRSGGIVNVHVDVNFSDQFVVLPFLGITKEFATGLMEIVRLTGCAVIPMVCLGNQRASSITFGPPFEMAASRSREEFVESNLPQLVRTVEGQILENPDQWELWTRL